MRKGPFTMLRSIFQDPARTTGQASRTSLRLNGWRELALGSLLAAELTWIGMLVGELTGLDETPGMAKVFALAAAVLLGAYYLARGFHYFQVRMAARRVLFLILIAVSAWLCLAALGDVRQDASAAHLITRPFLILKPGELIPVQFWQVLAILLIWYRAVSLARRPAGTDLSLSSFKFGMLMWMVYGLLNPFRGSVVEVGILMGFMFTGLLSLSAARFYEMTHLRGGTATRFHRSWLAGVAAAILLILAAGTVGAALLRGQFAELTRWVVSIVTMLGAGLFLLVISPFMLAFLYLIPWLEKNLVGIRLFEGLGDFSRQMFRLVDQLVDQEAIQLAASWIWGSRLLVIAGVLIGVAVLILLALRLKTWRERSEDAQDGEALLSRSDLLRKLQESLRQNLQEAMKGLRSRLGLRKARRLLATMRIRWIYTQLLELCSRMGRPRHPAATPLEYLPMLEPLFPNHRTDLSTITQAYLNVRYGQIPETEEDFKGILSAWNRVRQEGRTGLLRARKRS